MVPPHADNETAGSPEARARFLVGNAGSRSGAGARSSRAVIVVAEPALEVSSRPSAPPATRRMRRLWLAPVVLLGLGTLARFSLGAPLRLGLAAADGSPLSQPPAHRQVPRGSLTQRISPPDPLSHTEGPWRFLPAAKARLRLSEAAAAYSSAMAPKPRQPTNTPQATAPSNSPQVAAPSGTGTSGQPQSQPTPQVSQQAPVQAVAQPAAAASSSPTPAELGQQALGLVRYPWRSIPGYSIEFLPSSAAPVPGYYGNTTFSWGRPGGVSVLYVYPNESVYQLAGIIAFEIGHEVDAAYLYPSGGHAKIESILGIHPPSWAPNCDCPEQQYLSGWYAAAFSNYWSPGVGNWATIAPPPTAANAAAVDPLLNLGP